MSRVQTGGAVSHGRPDFAGFALSGLPVGALYLHEDPKMTANIYMRLGLVDGHAAVAKISLGKGSKARRA